MKLIVCKTFFCSLCFYLQPILPKTVLFIPIYTIILFSLFKSVLNQTLNTFNIKFLREWKDRESSYQLGEAFALFFNLLALTLS